MRLWEQLAGLGFISVLTAGRVDDLCRARGSVQNVFVLNQASLCVPEQMKDYFEVRVQCVYAVCVSSRCFIMNQTRQRRGRQVMMMWRGSSGLVQE